MVLITLDITNIKNDSTGKGRTMADRDIRNMPPEDDEGSNEYKFRLIDLTANQRAHMASQLKYRIHSDENCGQAIYNIGLTDDGFPLGLTEREMELSLESLEEIVTSVDAVICSVERHEIVHHADSEEDLITELISHRGKGAELDRKWAYVKEAKERGAPAHTRHIAELIIRRNYGKYWETKFGIAGHVDCGKSTLLGVLSSGELDNGRGSARLTVMKHAHERERGQSSSVTQEIIGFDESGRLVNEKLAKKSHTGGKIPWEDIVKGSKKIVTFFDLAGHLKYLNHTIRGLSSNELDYVLIIVGANMVEAVSADPEASKEKRKETLNMTKEHLELGLSLGMKCIVAVTKIDMVETSIKDKTVKELKRLIKSKFAHYSVDSMDNVKPCVDLMATGKVIPIVEISNKTGEGHDILRKLLHYLPPRRNYEDKAGEPVVLQIQDIFKRVEGTSTIIAGMLTSGEVRVRDATHPATELSIGPLSDGSFMQTRVRSIQCKRIDVHSARAGKYICIGLPSALDGNRVRKGMFAVSTSTKPQATWEFWADVRLAKAKSGKVQVGYTPYCYIGHIRQTCKILRIIKQPDDDQDDEWLEKAEDIDAMAAGEDARMLIRFCFRPELIFEEHRRKLVFKESRTKGIGTVFKTTDTIHKPLENKKVTKDAKSRPSRRERREARERKLQESGLVVPESRRKANTRATISKGKMTL